VGDAQAIEVLNASQRTILKIISFEGTIPLKGVGCVSVSVMHLTKN